MCRIYKALAPSPSPSRSPPAAARTRASRRNPRRRRPRPTRSRSMPRPPATITGKVVLRGHAAREPGHQDASDPGVRDGGEVARRDLRRRQRRPEERVRLHQGRARQQIHLRHADRAGEDRSEGLPLRAARRRRADDAAAARSSTATARCTTCTACRRTNREFNQGQPVQGMKNTVTFTAPEVLIPFKCDVHAWMNAYVGVVDHPYFAVTRRRRQVRAARRAARHLQRSKRCTRSSAAQSQPVTLGEKDSKELTFTFKAQLRRSRPRPASACALASLVTPSSSPPARCC